MGLKFVFVVVVVVIFRFQKGNKVICALQDIKFTGLGEAFCIQT